MEFLFDLKFEDNNYNAIIHFLSTVNVENESEAHLFYNELIEAFKRRGVLILFSSYNRIDNDPVLKERTYEYHEFYLSRATAKIEIEQFILNKPDQNKSLYDNLIEKFFNGERSTATIGNKYKIPVRVLDKKTRNPISGEFYYFSVEHLIPKK